MGAPKKVNEHDENYQHDNTCNNMINIGNNMMNLKKLMTNTWTSTKWWTPTKFQHNEN